MGLTLPCLGEDEIKKRLHKDARRELNEQLLEGECAVVVIEGNSAQAMIATNLNRVLVFKKGMMAGVSFGRRMHSWDFSRITSVRVDVRIMNGYVALETMEGDDEELSYWGINSSDAWTSANAIPIARIDQQQAREGAATLRRMLHAYNSQDKRMRDSELGNSTSSYSANLVQDDETLASEHVTASQGRTIQFCFACGYKLQPKAAFCSACGQRSAT
jgi:hypothetical protein